MNTKAKTTLIILGTLVIGIAIGALGGSAFRGEKERQFERMRHQQRFRRVIEEIIQPTEKQRQAIKNMLSKRFEQLSAIREKHQEEIFAIYDSLQKDLATALTEEQRASLKEELAHGHQKLLRNRIEQMTSELNLDEKQSRQIEAIFAKMTAERKSHRQHNRGDWSESRQSRMSHFKKMQEEIEAVLTPEQRIRYREMRMRRQPEFGPPMRGPFPDKPFKKRRVGEG